MTVAAVNLWPGRAGRAARPLRFVGGGERRAASAGARVGRRAGDPAPGGQVFRRTDALVNRFQFVDDHGGRFGVKRLCQVIGVARSSYYHWVSTAAAQGERVAADAVLAERIRAVHLASDMCAAKRYKIDVVPTVKVQSLDHAVDPAPGRQDLNLRPLDPQ